MTQSPPFSDAGRRLIKNIVGPSSNQRQIGALSIREFLDRLDDINLQRIDRKCRAVFESHVEIELCGIRTDDCLVPHLPGHDETE